MNTKQASFSFLSFAYDLLLSLHIIGTSNSQIIAQHTGNHTADRYFYLHDRLGSVRQVIDTSADVKNRYTYDQFGEPYPAPNFEEEVDNSFKFTGRYFYCTDKIRMVSSQR